jgi:hypothetical protein
MRVPKKPRGEQAQQKLRRLRQLRQQRQLSRQARAEQLQVWQVAAQLQKQWQLQQQQQDAAAAGPQQEAGTVQGVGPVVQPAPGSSSSSDGGSSSSGTMAASPSSPSVDSAKKGRWMAAVQRFKAAWKQGKQQQQQQPRPSPLSPAGSDAAVGDAQAASEAVVQELQAWLAGAAAGVAGRPVASTGPQTEDSVGVLVIAVLPLQQLPLVKQAWGRQGSQ